jgi:hypothetical protein
VAGTPVIPSGALAELRLRAVAGMQARCTVQRPTAFPGQGGSPTTQWTDLPGLVAVPCWPVSGALARVIRADTTQGLADWRIRLGGAALNEGTPDIRTGDRLRITGHGIPGVSDPLLLYAAGPSGVTGVEVTRLVVATPLRPGGL